MTPLVVQINGNAQVCKVRRAIACLAGLLHAEIPRHGVRAQTAVPAAGRERVQRSQADGNDLRRTRLFRRNAVFVVEAQLSDL